MAPLTIISVSGLSNSVLVGVTGKPRTLYGGGRDSSFRSPKFCGDFGLNLSNPSIRSSVDELVSQFSESDDGNGADAATSAFCNNDCYNGCVSLSTSESTYCTVGFCALVDLSLGMISFLVTCHTFVGFEMSDVEYAFMLWSKPLMHQ